MDPGARPHLVVIERNTPTTDGLGQETPVWAEYHQAWARVRYGTSAERREAAAEAATQVATLEFDWSPELAAVTAEDRMLFNGFAWDIVSAVLIGGNREVHVTAIAIVD